MVVDTCIFLNCITNYDFMCSAYVFVLLVVRFSRWLSLITNKEAESWPRGDLYLQASPHWLPILLKLLGKLRLKVVINWLSVCTMGYISASYMPYPNLSKAQATALVQCTTRRNVSAYYIV